MTDTGLPIGARASMEPMDIAVGYCCGTQRERRLAPGYFASCENEDAGLTASWDGEVLELGLTAKQDLRVERVEINLRHAFTSDEKVLFNGYQSWTDTIERPPFGRMRGLRGVPAGIVKRYALDGSGDYAQVDYTARRGCMHGFTYASFRRGEGMVLVGSLDERRGFTLICGDAAHGIVTLRPECPARTIAAGEQVTLGRVAVVRGSTEQCYDRWFDLSGIKARPITSLCGYTSWYRHYGDIDEQKLASDLEGAARFFAEEVSGASEPGEDAVGQAIATGRLRKLFQIDDGYCKVGDWLDVDARKFPHGLADLASRIRAAGFLPGLWIAPFVCERDSRVFLEHQEWLLRDEHGDPVATGSHWSGGYALDTRNVEVRSYVLESLQEITRSWGFGLVKADFLYAACMLPHDGLNRGELMADAMELLRTGVGENVLILGCGVPLASAFGLVDYCRIGCDVGLDWDDVLYMRLLHRERVSTKNSLANTYGRAPLDGRAFGNDPDVFFLRDDVRISRACRDELLFADADLGSVLLTSDDMGAWDEASKMRYREALRVLL